MEMVDRQLNESGKWIELSVEVDNEAVEPVTELMSRHAYGQGVAVYEQYRQDPDGDNLEPDPNLPVTVVAYLPAGNETSQQVQQIEHGLWHLKQIGNVGPLRQLERPEEDWANAWKEHFQVLRIGRRFVIRPTWREYQPVEGDLIIDLDPGMAFGTGHHPTTELCLRWMEELPIASKRLLDVGAGSGILSIAGTLLEAKSIDAIEIDDVAGRALLENLELNAVDKQVNVSIGDFGSMETVPFPRYDLVIANIISSILMRMAPQLVASVGSGGRLLLSGVIDRHIEQLRQVFTDEGATILEERQQGDWFALLLKRDD